MDALGQKEIYTYNKKGQLLSNMVLVMVKIFGIFFLTIVITFIWILHKKRHTTFIKYKPKGEKETKKYIK